MKRQIISIALIGFSALVGWGCCSKEKSNQAVQTVAQSDVVLKDYGAKPTVLNIEDYTMANDDYRNTLWTGDRVQVTLMSIPVGSDVGLEMHPDVDQFFRIEQGSALVEVGMVKDSLNYRENADADFAIIVPAGHWHNLTNTSDVPLKLYTIYSPAEHAHGTVHKTKQESIEADHHH